MATLLLSGTRLEPQVPRVPLNKSFLVSIGFVYLIAMHIFMPNSGGDGLALPFNATTWLGVSLSVSIGLYQLGTYRHIRYSKLTIGLWACCTIMTLPIFFTNAHWDSVLERLIGLWAGFSLFLVLQQFRFSNKHKQRLLWYVVLASLIEALFGLYQYWLLTPDNIFHYDSIQNRPYGIFQNTDSMASFLATGVVLSGYLLARQPKKYNKKLSDVSLLYVTPVLTLPVLIVLHSLIGWVSASLGIVLVLHYLYRFSPRQRFTNWVIASAVGLIIGFAALFLQNGDGTENSPIMTPSSYSQILPQSIDMLIEKPFTGYGYGRFESSYILYTARQHQLNANYPAGLLAMEHPHNEILFWGVEGGLLPVFGIALAASFVLVRIYSAKKGTRLAMFALLIPIVIHSLLGAPFYPSAIHWITLVILLFWVDQRVARYRVFQFSKLSRTFLRITSLITPVIVCFYTVSVLHSNFYLTKFEKSIPRDLEILQKIYNPVLVKQRLDWDIYSTRLHEGLVENNPEFFQPYIDWSLNMIKDKPRPEFYINLIQAYQGIGDISRAVQTQTEAEFLFPAIDFSNHQYDSLIKEKNNIDLDMSNQ